MASKQRITFQFNDYQANLKGTVLSNPFLASRHHLLVVFLFDIIYSDSVGRFFFPEQLSYLD